MDPHKESVDMKPAVINKQQAIPGGLGWGVNRQHLTNPR